MRMYSQIDKNGDRTPQLVEYPGTGNQENGKGPQKENRQNFSGLIYTFMDKFQFNEVKYKQVMSEWNKHKSGLKVNEGEIKAFTSSKSLAQADGEEVQPNYIRADVDSFE